MAVSFWANDFLGPYRNLYCCAKDNSKKPVAIPVILFFACCGSMTVFQYVTAFKRVKVRS